MGNVRVNSDLRLTGELRAPRIEGDLGVTTGSINLDPILAQTGDSAYATKQTEYATAAPAEGQTGARRRRAFDALQMDVHLTVPNDLVVKGSDLQAADAPIGLGAMNVTLGGDLHRQQGAVGSDPAGRHRQHRARHLRLPGPPFTILRDGTIRFDGLDELDPSLDIRTQRVIQGVEANVNVRGTLKKPEIVLTSTPPLEQADILSLIVFNQPINQLGEGAADLAGAARAGAGDRRRRRRAREVDRQRAEPRQFEINTAPDSGGAAQLTIGQQLGQNLYVKVQQGIGDQSQTNFILEYELTKWLRLQTNVLQGSSTQQQLFQRMQGSGVDLLFFFSY